MPPFEPAPPTAPSRSPGWYPDPVTDGRTDRWWTGEGWSGYSRPHVVAAPLPPGMVDMSIRRRNSTAPLSLLLGILALLLAVGSALSGSHIVLSWAGVAAIVLGVRALRLRERGLATSLVPALVGAASGGLATLIMVALLLVPVATPSFDGAGSGSAGQTGADPAPVLPSAAPSTDQNDAMPRATLPDDALDSYADVPIRRTTSATAGCGVLTADLTAFPVGSGRGTEAKRMQDFADLQLQQMSSVLRYGPQVTKPMHWPVAIDLDPETNVVFLPSPTCQPLGVLPKGDELHYAMSPDRGQMALAIWNPQYRTGELWRTVDDTIYPL